MKTTGISVILCCYNSEAVIVPALESLLCQQMPAGFNAEVILVDNNCTDNTVKIATELWDNSDSIIPFKIVRESAPGLTYARRTGLSAAAFDIVVFCDDDNRLSPGYLASACTLMQQHKNIGAAGGICEEVTDTGYPAWWPQHRHAYAVGNQGECSGDISHLRYLWGAGMIAGKKILEEVLNDRFPLLLSDRKENLLSSGGDSEICARIILMGYELWFDERLHLQHYIQSKKLTEAYRDKLYEGHHAAMPVLQKYQQAIIEKKLKGLYKIRRCLRLTLSLISGRMSDYDKVAMNIICKSNFAIKDEDYKTIIAFIKASA